MVFRLEQADPGSVSPTSTPQGVGLKAVPRGPLLGDAVVLVRTHSAELGEFSPIAGASQRTLADVPISSWPVQVWISVSVLRAEALDRRRPRCLSASTCSEVAIQSLGGTGALVGSWRGSTRSLDPTGGRAGRGHATSVLGQLRAANTWGRRRSCRVRRARHRLDPGKGRCR